MQVSSAKERKAAAIIAKPSADRRQHLKKKPKALRINQALQSTSQPATHTSAQCCDIRGITSRVMFS